jgi:hypothetical protein
MCPIRDAAVELGELGRVHDRVGHAGCLDQPLLRRLAADVVALQQPICTDD